MLWQWKPGDPEPESWFDFYRYSPCVPIDYSSIPKAMSVAMEPAPPLRSRGRLAPPKPPQQVRSVRILLRPGTYCLRQALEIQALPGVVVIMETMELPPNLFRPPPRHSHPVRTTEAIMEQPLPPLSGDAPSTKRRPSFRRLFSCHRQESLEETDLEETDFTTTEDWRLLDAPPPPHAILVLRSRRPNEPVVRVRQGFLHLRRLAVQHSSPGMDIWNGNAAVQIQPPLGEDDRPLEVYPRPTVILQRTHVSSLTGRGIVNIDGGRVVLQRCAVTDCAATGVYIGGGSDALLQRTDVMRNGVGNRVRRGIARGHSGIYLEQGTARIQQSNVSNNTLTGISVVSPDHAFLTLEESSLVNNGTYQLELPPVGTLSRQRTQTRDNQLAVRGEAVWRSGLAVVVPPPPPEWQAPLRPLAE
jgi:Right handed beta helix region